MYDGQLRDASMIRICKATAMYGAFRQCGALPNVSRLPCLAFGGWGLGLLCITSLHMVPACCWLMYVGVCQVLDARC
jgi:hypothetical protein